jgi:hypothetical protein
MKITSIESISVDDGWKNWLFVRVSTDSGLSVDICVNKLYIDTRLSSEFYFLRIGIDDCIWPASLHLPFPDSKVQLVRAQLVIGR